LYKAKLVSEEAVSKFDLPLFEGGKEPPRAARKAERKSHAAPARTPADIEKEAFAKGFAEGRRAGEESAARETAALLAGLSAAIAGVEELRKQVVKEVEPQVVELAVAVARRVLVGELSENPERIVEIVKEAIRRIERSGSVTIRVHPELSRVVSSLKGRSAEFQADILLDVDPSVPVHGPIVTGGTEEVLTDVDEQIRVIMDELRSARAER